MHLVIIDGPDTAERKCNSFLLPSDDNFIFGQAGWGDADASARFLTQLLHQAVVGAGNKRVEGLFQSQTLHSSLVLA